MNISDFISFLEKFHIDNKIVQDFIKEKELITFHNQLFLTLSKNPQTQELVFLNLQRQVPSSFLLAWIKKHVSEIAKASSQKQANNFVFGKHFTFDGIQGVRMKQGYYYLVEFENKILGYVSLNKKEKLLVRNEFNIGEYLKE